MQNLHFYVSHVENSLGGGAHHVLLMTWDPWKQAVLAANGVSRFSDLVPLDWKSDDHE